jgi:hypothetical protein
MQRSCSEPQAVNELGLLLIALSTAALIVFVSARRRGDRGAAQVAAGVIIAILLVLAGFVVASVYFAPFD